MKKLALATAAVMALAFSAPTFTAPASAQEIKVKVGERHHDRGRHEGWRHHRAEKVVIHRDRGRHEGWRHRDTSIKKKVIIKHGRDGGKTVIKKKYEG
jgi:hypothetical protein